ncbi:carboxymuconolactone decarboxylase family protein [Streptomyces sp. NPDC046915]|uniref:carboxymuconolactone decarboxylase family protein n=1 Tax=Streptomyces sp. NPDC046915 TaxID=3155257 RepID=UPI0033E7A35B
MTDEHHHRPDRAADDAGPRLAPLPEDGWDPSTRELLSPVPRDADGRLANIITTMVRHPGLFQHFLPFGSHLLRDGRLPDRTRELLILRTACNTRAGYEWGRHVPLARAAGVTDEEIRRVGAGPDAQEWTPADARLLRATDELHRDARLSAATWSALAADHDEAQLIEITMLPGRPPTATSRLPWTRRSAAALAWVASRHQDRHRAQDRCRSAWWTKACHCPSPIQSKTAVPAKSTPRFEPAAYRPGVASDDVRARNRCRLLA